MRRKCKNFSKSVYQIIFEILLGDKHSKLRDIFRFLEHLLLCPRSPSSFSTKLMCFIFLVSLLFFTDSSNARSRDLLLPSALFQYFSQYLVLHTASFLYLDSLLFPIFDFMYGASCQESDFQGEVQEKICVKYIRWLGILGTQGKFIAIFSANLESNNFFEI